MLQTNAPDDSESIRCAHQLCSYPTARAKLRKPTTSRPRASAPPCFGQEGARGKRISARPALTP
eukprot:7751907-Pyramimonas_sp.AAC.1